MTYRPEIDGLRALAVLAVVLFHLGFAPLAGGFVGVDVFFVISGYLITQLILAKVEAGTFSLAGFYLRRIRRLLPPLLVTIVLAAAASAFILAPYDFRPFARSALAAMVSLSNVAFYAEAGYWDADSELKPLLHTWSLGVEEQFYLAWPALLLALHAQRRWLPLGWSLGGLAVGSAALTVWYTDVDSAAAFFLSPFRVFQFAAGAAIPFLLQSRPGAVAAAGPLFARGSLAVGLALVLGSVVRFDADTLYPGTAALLPTAGAVLALLGTAAPAAGGPLLALLRSPPAIWLGKVSYALYLVHWPLVSLYRYRTGGDLELGEQVVLGVLMLLCAWALHAGVERRYYRRAGERSARQDRARLGDGAFALRIAAVVAALAVPTATAWLGDGWAWRFEQHALSPEAIAEGERRRFTHSRDACNLRTGTAEKCRDAPIQVLVLGNSHEVDGFNFLHALYEDDPAVALVLFGGTDSCGRLRVLDGRITAEDPRCTARFAELLTPAVARRFDVLALSASNRAFSRLSEPFLVAARRLRALNPSLRIMTFGSYMKTRVPCARLINETGSSDACGAPANLAYFEEDPSSERYFDAFMALSDLYVDRIDLLCTERALASCPTRTPEGVPAFYDRHHHSLEFARFTARRYADAHHSDPVRELLRQGTP